MGAERRQAVARTGRGKWILCALAVLIAVMAAGYWAIAKVAGNTASRSHLDTALAARTQRDFATAEVALKNAAQEAPENHNVRRLLGETYLALSRGEAAEIQFQKALEFGAAPERVDPLMIQSLLLQKKYQQLLDRPAMTEAQTDVLAYRGHAHLALGQTEQARARYEEALALDASNAPARLGLARVAASMGDLQLAREHLSALVAEHAEFTPAWLMLGDIEAAEGKADAAIEAYTKAIEIPGDRVASYTARLRRAVLRIDANALDEAAADLTYLQDEDVNGPEVKLGLAQIAMLREDRARAKVLAQELVIEAPEFAPGWFINGFVAFQDGNVAQAEGWLEKYHDARPRSLQTAIILASIRLDRGDLDGARSVLANALRANPDDEQLLTLYAHLMLAGGAVEEAIATLQERLEKHPESIAARLDMGAVLGSVGRTGDALQVFESTVDDNPGDATALVTWFEELLRSGQTERALQVASTLRERYPSNQSVLAMQAMAHLAAGNLTQAREAATETLALSPNHLSANRTLLQIATREGKTEEAREIRERILTIDPGDINALRRRADEALSEGRFDDAVQTYKQMVAANRTNLPSRLVLSRLQVRAGDDTGALETLEQAVKFHPSNSTARLELAGLYSRLGRNQDAAAALRPVLTAQTADPALLRAGGVALLAAGDARQALELFDRLAALRPDSVEAHYLRARAFARAGDEAGVDNALAAAIRVDPNYAPVQIASVRRFISKRELENAAAILQRLDKAHPDSPEILLLGGDVEAARGRFAAAVNRYARAHELAPSTATVARLARAQARAGASEASLATLEDWLSEHSDDAEIRVSLAEAQQALGNRERAVSEYEAAIERQPNNVVALNNLAMLYHDAKRKDALTSALKALRLAPENPAVLDTVGWIMVETGQAAQGVTLLEKAVRLAPNSTTLRFHYALGLIANGQVAQGQRELETLLARKDDFAERARAQMTLQQLQ